jgi:hypothetical protein
MCRSTASRGMLSSRNSTCIAGSLMHDSYAAGTAIRSARLFDHAAVKGIPRIRRGMRSSSPGGRDRAPPEDSEEDGRGMEGGRRREGLCPFSAELTDLIFLSSAALDFGILRQPQPDMRDVLERGSGSRHSQAARQLQTFLGVTPILFWLSHRNEVPNPRGFGHNANVVQTFPSPQGSSRAVNPAKCPKRTLS